MRKKNQLSSKHLCDEKGLLGDVVVCSPEIGRCSDKLHCKIVLLVEDSLANLCGPALQELPYALNQHLCNLPFSRKESSKSRKREKQRCFLTVES